MDQLTTLAGWGNNTPVTSHLTAPSSANDVSLLVKQAPLIARGLGRSYGDAAQLAGGTTVVTTAFQGISRVTELADDSQLGHVTVGAGVSLLELSRVLRKGGWSLPVVPGTGHVTVGGAIASDVHGKGHHRDGSFGNHVQELRIVDGLGHTRILPAGSEEFTCTVGGMGLTGIILDAVLIVRRSSGRVTATEQRCPDLGAIMATLEHADDTHHYSAAWIDTTATGSGFGRGVVSIGDRLEVPLRDTSNGGGRPDVAGADAASRSVSAPQYAPNWLLNRYSIAAFNELWFRKASARPHPRTVNAAQFFHPLDGVDGWNRLYGRRGFVQYQFVVPDSASHVVQRSIETLQRAHAPSLFSVLKRFGPGNDAPLSFPMAGWTLAMDIPADVSTLGTALDALDEDVAAAGGRIYLTKDSRARAEVIAATYPKLAEWRRVRAALDPQDRFRSDLSRRLKLTED